MGRKASLPRYFRVYVLLGLVLSTGATLAAASWGLGAFPYGNFLTQSHGSIGAACTTPSVLLPRTKKDAALCVSEHSVKDLTEGDWKDLKWGSIEIMCRGGNHSLVFFLENCPRFSWNPLRIVGSAARRVLGSIDMRTAAVPLGPMCECDPKDGKPFFSEIFEKEQYITGVKVQSTARRVYQFFPEQTTCELPLTWQTRLIGLPLGPPAPPPPAAAAAAAAATPGTAAAGTAAAQPVLAAGAATPSADYYMSRPGDFIFYELQSCLWKISLPFKPNVFAARNEVFVKAPDSSVPGSQGGRSQVSLDLPPACQMRDVPNQLRVWIKASAAAAAAAAAPGLVHLEHQQQQQMEYGGSYEVYVQVTAATGEAATPNSAYYRRVMTIAEFDLAVQRGIL